MKTWTCTNFEGHYTVGTTLVVTAESIDMAIAWVENALAAVCLPQTIKPEQLIPLPTRHRHVRILVDENH